MQRGAGGRVGQSRIQSRTETEGLKARKGEGWPRNVLKINGPEACRRNGERLGWAHEFRRARAFSNFSETHNKKHFAYQDPGNTHSKNKKMFQKYLSLHLYMNVYNLCLDIKWEFSRFRYLVLLAKIKYSQNV